MQPADIGKLIFATVVVVSTAVLIATGRVDQGAGFGLIGTVTGIVIGNGMAATAGKVTTPIIAPRAPERSDVVLTADGPRKLVELDPGEKP